MSELGLQSKLQPSIEPPGVTSVEENAFDELFLSCCHSGRDVARVEDIVSRICDIRKDTEEDTGTGLLCNRLYSNATEGLMNISTYKKVVELWIQDVNVQQSPSTLSSFTASLTSSPLKSFSVPFSSTLQGEFGPSGSHLSHESLEAEGGSFRESLDVTEMQHAVEQLKSENVRLRDQQHHLESHCELREESMRKLQLEKTTLDKRVRTFSQQLEQKELEAEALRQQITERNETSDNLNSKLQNLEQVRADLEQEVTDVRSQLEESQQMVAELEERIREVEGKEGEHTKRLQECRVECEALDERYISVAQDNVSLSHQLEVIKEENISLQKEFKIMESELDVTKSKIATRGPLHSPLLSSTPIQPGGIPRQKSIREEIEDTGSQFMSSLEAMGKGSTPGSSVMGDSLDQSLGSGLEGMSLSASLDVAEIEECTSLFQQNQEQALQLIEELLEQNSSSSPREHPSLRFSTSLELPGVEWWETLDAKLHKLLADRKKLIEKVKEYRRKISDLKKELAETRSGPRSKDAQVEELTGVIDQLKKNCASLIQEAADSEQQMQSARSALQETSDEVKYLKEEVSDLQTENSEAHEECLKLEKKCMEQSNKIIQLATVTGTAEQRSKDLQDLLQSNHNSHRRSLKNLLNVVQGREERQEDDDEDVDSTNPSGDRSFSEDEEILTIDHVSYVLKAKMKELKDGASMDADLASRHQLQAVATQTEADRTESSSTFMTSQSVTGAPFQRRTGSQSARGMEPVLVRDKIEVVDIPASSDKGLLQRQLVREDQPSLHIASKARSTSQTSSLCYRTFRLVLLLLFFVFLVLAVLATMAILEEAHYCPEPCNSPIKGLIYHALYPYFDVSHGAIRPT